jgi:glycosyltransferase involved in cell wall biosynthesis
MARILIPILGFARTGGYRVLSELGNAWVKRRHTVAFLSPSGNSEPYFPTSASVLWVDRAGTVSADRRAGEKPTATHNLLALFRGLKALGAGYDVVLANHSLTAWPVALAPCGAARKFYYVQAYEPEFYTSRGTAKAYVLAALSALSYWLPLRRIVNAELYFRYKNLRADTMVPPGIDLDVFKPGAGRSTAERVIIGCIGRSEREKGTEYVLKAFEQLHRENAKYRLRVAYGNLPPGWRHEACEIVVPRNDSELARYYCSLDVLVAAGTIQHGAPHYPVLESWACGVPVVTTGYMGADNHTAWIVANRDADSICAAVREVASDKAKRREKVRRALEHAQRYSWDEVAEQMLALFAGREARH